MTDIFDGNDKKEDSTDESKRIWNKDDYQIEEDKRKTYREYETINSTDHDEDVEEGENIEEDEEINKDLDNKEPYREYETINSTDHGEEVENRESTEENEEKNEDFEKREPYREYETINPTNEEEEKENFNEEEENIGPSSYREYETKNFSRDEKTKEDNKVRYIVRDELQRNFNNKKTPWFKILALVLVGAILGSALTMVGSSFFNTKEVAVNNNGGFRGDNIVINPTEEVNVENAVAMKASPSVVGVVTTINNELDAEGFFFGIPPATTYSEAIGSGVIISEDGYILTNSHVVNNGDYTGDINIVFQDGSDATGELLWNDESLDLAVMKVDKTGLRPIELGDSDKIKVGDKAIAIGNPLTLNLQSTLTSGYISGLDRSITMQDGSVMDGLVQTDAAINGGNSGGALLNSQGQLIGINTAKASQADGIGFAIPINTALPIVEKVVKTGSFETVYLGITGIALDQYAHFYPDQEFPTDHGILVASVVDGSFADQAGLKKGDIIYSIDGNKTESMSGLKRILIRYSYGDEATIEYHNGEEVVKAKATFTSIPADRT